jgi:hypothetical protein
VSGRQRDTSAAAGPHQRLVWAVLHQMCHSSVTHKRGLYGLQIELESCWICLELAPLHLSVCGGIATA